MSFLANIKYHLSHLVNFAGRETRSQFWPYAVLVVALMTVLTMAVTIPMLADSISKVQEYARQQADSASARSAAGQQSMPLQASRPDLMPDVSRFVPPFAVLGLVSILLLAAAVTRRLRDAGRPVAMGLAPLPFLAFGLMMMPNLFAHGGGSSVMLLFLNNMLYLATLAALLLMLASPSAGAAEEAPTRVTHF